MAPTTATSGTLDLRDDFPTLHQDVGGKPLVYLDNAATTQKPEAVLRAVEAYYRRDNANVHRGIHELSRRATESYEATRRRMSEWVGAASPVELVWTRGTTEAINLVASSWGAENVGEGDEILLSVMEHHSNIVPWQLLARRTGATLRYLDIDEEGRLRLDQLPDLLTERTKMVALSHVSNALGTVNPVADIVPVVREHSDARILIDGAQAVPHQRVYVQALDVDFYAFSGHKMCGPTGVGGLWGRETLLEAMPPYQGGGEMIRTVEKDHSTWAALPHKFEAGTPNIAAVVGLAAAVDYLDSVGMDAIRAHERQVLGHALERMRELDDIRIFGPDALEERSGVISFTLGDAHPHDISTIVDAEGVAVRAGHHCAQLVMKRYGIAATARASFYLYNTVDDADRLVDALEVVQGIFRA